MKRRRLIIDCDPGVDDATALLLAFASPKELDILGVTVVAGNTGLAQTVRNARIIRQIAKREDVPVYAGCARPMVRDIVDAGEFHGESGLGPLPIFEPDAPAAEGHAVDFIVRTLMAADEKVTLAVTGPATNVAMALVLEPRIAAKIAHIVVMGGARSAGGNITASAEFNIFADPHAAHVMLTAGCQVTMFGLDATYQVLTTPARVTALEAVATEAARASALLMRFSNELEVKPPRRAGSPLHDPCTIAWLLKSDLFVVSGAKVSVETNAGLAFGHTAVEFRADADEVNANWVIQADGQGVFDLIVDRLGRL
ncbi:Pyrimidine-specific ribonucleoside hydrolase RihA [Alphaproteobacteria bacterium SO-S41]|nr:Pyrimidine-specific ribonucleoside hydrolase RihA [Alphaproteobacteria bacterium SO-S41]